MDKISMQAAMFQNRRERRRLAKINRLDKIPALLKPVTRETYQEYKQHLAVLDKVKEAKP